jgi:hypothetical protein
MNGIELQDLEFFAAILLLNAIAFGNPLCSDGRSQ